MYPENTLHALREFLLMHHCPVDPNFVEGPTVHYYGVRAKNFITAWLYLKSELERCSPDEIRTICFAAGKLAYGEEKNNLRDWFADMNLVLHNKSAGPQLSEFIRVFGRENFTRRVDARLKNYMTLFLL